MNKWLGRGDVLPKQAKVMHKDDVDHGRVACCSNIGVQILDTF